MSKKLSSHIQLLKRNQKKSWTRVPLKILTMWTQKQTASLNKEYNEKLLCIIHYQICSRQWSLAMKMEWSKGYRFCDMILWIISKGMKSFITDHGCPCLLLSDVGVKLSFIDHSFLTIYYNSLIFSTFITIEFLVWYPMVLCILLIGFVPRSVMSQLLFG